MTSHDDFDAEMDAYISRRSSKTPKAIAAVLGLGAAVWAATGLFGSDGVTVQLEGSGVDKLEPGAMVALKTTPVGEVTDVRAVAGKMVADIHIGEEHVAQISRNSTLRVESLNEWTPGNIGVRIYPPERGEFGETEEITAMEDGLVFQSPESILPVGIPGKFYILIGIGIVVIALGFGIASAFKEVILKTIVFAICAGVLWGGYMYFSNRIAPPAPVELGTF